VSAIKGRVYRAQLGVRMCCSACNVMALSPNSLALPAGVPAHELRSSSIIRSSPIWRLRGVPKDKMRIFVRGRVKVNQRDWVHAETAGVHRGARHGSAAACIVQENRQGVNSQRQRRAAILVVLVSVAAAIVAVPSVREPVLRAAGWALVVNEPLAPADIIVISADSESAGVLEAADLVKSGIATRVAVFTDPPGREDLEFVRRGLPYEDGAARQIRQLRWLDVTDVVQISRPEAGTEAEGQVLPSWCDQHQLRSLVFVAARDHSRRTRRMLSRVMNGHLTRVSVQSTSYSDFDPDRWWESRGGIRTEIVELQKLVLDVVLHPMPF
jgi:hypothetical protein